jgi:hypothetical protein
MRAQIAIHMIGMVMLSELIKIGQILGTPG